MIRCRLSIDTRVIGIFILSTALVTSAQTCKNSVVNFLGNPSKGNYTQLVNPRTSQELADCWSIIDTNEALRTRADNLVTTGNEWTIRFVASTLKRLDGGSLEDALITLGRASHRSPELLLSLANAGNISYKERGDAVTMRPETLIDKDKESIDEMRARAESFKSVRKPALDRPKAYVLKQLQGVIQELENAGS